MLQVAGVTFQRWVPETPPTALSTALFDGALVVFSGLAPVMRLARRARALLRETFDCQHPPRAAARFAGPEFRERAMRARRLIAADERMARHWRDTLAAVGYAPEVWQDRLRLRVVPPLAARGHSAHRRIGVLPPHRDTWGSGIAAQVNWWLPLYRLAPERTMLIWPTLFRLPVSNDSGAWQFERARDDQRYPLLPTATERPQAPATPVLIKVGELLAFSAAHLHGGAADRSGTVRLSLDSRTVWAPDKAQARGAPNMDNDTKAQRWEWFEPPRGS